MWSRILLMLEKRGITAYKLSKETGISQGNIASWKAGRSKPSYGALVKISKALNVSIDYLAGESDEPEITTGDRAEDIILDDLSYALLDGFKSLTDDQKREIITFVEFLTHRDCSK